MRERWASLGNMASSYGSSSWDSPASHPPSSPSHIPSLPRPLAVCHHNHKRESSLYHLQTLTLTYGTVHGIFFGWDET
jgi:hypothetical protein